MRGKTSRLGKYGRKFSLRRLIPSSLFLPSREENLALYRRSRTEGSEDCPNSPLLLLVEVTSSCNLSCKMCNVHHDTKAGITIPDALLEATFKLAKGANTVSPFGLGEPLLHPRIGEIVGKYKSLGTTVALTSNGMLLNEEKSRELIMSGLDQLAISVDAAEPVLFSEIRRGADLQRISENIMTLNRLKQSLQSGKPVLSINVVVQVSNFSQLPRIIQMADAWDVRFVTFVPVTAHEHISEIRGMAIGPKINSAEEIIEECRSEAKARGISIDMLRLEHVLHGSRWEEAYRETIPCPEPFRFIVIRANGDIFPCCNWDLEKPIAKIPASQRSRLKDLEKAWRSDVWQALREKIVSGRYPSECRTCMANFTRPFRDENLANDSAPEGLQSIDRTGRCAV